MSPARGQIAIVKWTGGESIQTATKSATLGKAESNKEILSACLSEFGAVKMRIGISCYGPGTEDKPTPRQWWLLGESYSVAARGIEEAEWFIGALREWIGKLDGIELERI